MDFGELLHTAKKNDQTKPQIQYYSTKFAPPKKEQRSKSLSVNVQKFLAKKEAEEQKKREEAIDRRNKLLELRAKDKKATRRVNVMLKRTKSANQSVIADALDTDNTAVTLAGPSQPDEDDYGYVSQESSALYNKMMEKYSKMPEEPKFPTERKKVSTNLTSTKDRVRAALEREREEALLPHRRKRKQNETEGEKSKNVEQEPEPEPEKKETVKPKFKAAPLVNFSDLLKLAEKKQFEPVVIEPKKEEEERPLTKKQKKEYEREKEWRERKESQNRAMQEKKSSVNRIPKLNTPASEASLKIPKKTDHEDSRKMQKSKDSTSDVSNINKLDRNSNITKNDKISNKSVRFDGHTEQSTSKLTERGPQLVKKTIQQQRPINDVKNIRPSEKPRPDMRRDEQMPPPRTKVPLETAKPKEFPPRDFQSKKTPTADGKLKSALQNGLKSKQVPPNDLRNKQFTSDQSNPKQLPPNGLKSKQFPPNDLKPKQFPPNDLKPKQFPPNDLKPKQFQPNDLRPKQFSSSDVRRKNPPPSSDIKKKQLLNKRRIIDDDEDEYDSEMDDFIDDGPEGEEDYSKYIGEIFGYDKRRYRFEDDDVDDMESSFAQQMKEEVISTKIGIMEDLEDMKQEEEAKKRKLIMKKRRKL